MVRSDVSKFTDIPNIGKTMERDFKLLGLRHPSELAGKDPYLLFNELCRITAKKQDPCVIDIFISAVRYMEGGPARKWWEFTAERKRILSEK